MLKDEFGNPGNYLLPDTRSVVSNADTVLKIDSEAAFATSQSHKMIHPYYDGESHIAGSPGWRQAVFAQGKDPDTFLAADYPYSFGPFDERTFGILASLFFPPPNSPPSAELMALFLKYNGDIAAAAHEPVQISVLENMLTEEAVALRAIRASGLYDVDTPLQALPFVQMCNVARSTFETPFQPLTIGDAVLGRFKHMRQFGQSKVINPDFTQFSVPRSPTSK